jgi:hypothetical protein
MPRFEVAVTQRETAPVDAAAATKCKCKCDNSGLDPAAVRRRPARAEEHHSNGATRPSVELSPLAEEPTYNRPAGGRVHTE